LRVRLRQQLCLRLLPWRSRECELVPRMDILIQNFRGSSLSTFHVAKHLSIPCRRYPRRLPNNHCLRAAQYPRRPPDSHYPNVTCPMNSPPKKPKRNTQHTWGLNTRPVRSSEVQSCLCKMSHQILGRYDENEPGSRSPLPRSQLNCHMFRRLTRINTV